MIYYYSISVFSQHLPLPAMLYAQCGHITGECPLVTVTSKCPWTPDLEDFVEVLPQQARVTHVCLCDSVHMGEQGFCGRQAAHQGITLLAHKGIHKTQLITAHRRCVTYTGNSTLITVRRGKNDSKERKNNL